MWRALRIGFLLLVLLAVATQAWIDRFTTTGWQRTVYVGAFPVGADASPVTADYLAQLDQAKIAGVSDFVNAEARRYGVAVDEPIELRLYPTVASAPPVLEPGAGVLTRIVWSLRLRYYRHRMLAAVFPRPQIAMFLLYHDPALASSLPHSAGLQRGLTAVVHVFASPSGGAEPHRDGPRAAAYLRGHRQIRSGDRSAAVPGWFRRPAAPAALPATARGDHGRKDATQRYGRTHARRPRG